MAQAIVFDNRREAYGIEDISGRAMTVRELINRLEEEASYYGDDMKVVISNDNGYTYGAVMKNRIKVEDYESDEEDEVIYF